MEPRRWLKGVTSRSVGEKIKKVTNIVYFTYLPRRPAAPIVTTHQICSGADYQDVINCAKFHSNPFRGFDFVGGRILAFPVRNEVSPLTQGLNYRSACDSSEILDLKRCLRQPK